MAFLGTLGSRTHKRRMAEAWTCFGHRQRAAARELCLGMGSACLRAPVNSPFTAPPPSTQRDQHPPSLGLMAPEHHCNKTESPHVTAHPPYVMLDFICQQCTEIRVDKPPPFTACASPGPGISNSSLHHLAAARGMRQEEHAGGHGAHWARKGLGRTPVSSSVSGVNIPACFWGVLSCLLMQSFCAG